MVMSRCPARYASVHGSMWGAHPGYVCAPQCVQAKILKYIFFSPGLLAKDRCCLPNRLSVLLRDGGRLDVPAPRCSRENPLAASSTGEPHFQDRLNSLGHRNSTAGVIGLAVLNFDLVASDAFGAQPKTFFGPESAIQKNGRHV